MPTCNICGIGEATSTRSGMGGTIEVTCDNCGGFKISVEAWEDFKHIDNGIYYRKRHIISGYICEENGLGNDCLQILQATLPTIISSSNVPTTTEERLDKLLSHIDRHSEYLGHQQQLIFNTPAIGYAKHSPELIQMYKMLACHEYIELYTAAYSITKPIDKMNLFIHYAETHHPIYCCITPKGMQRIESRREARDSTQCFVAMRFSPEMDAIYNDWITPAVAATGFRPLRVDEVEHNGKICDRIIAEIRRSRFIISDFTGQRGGVYFEAGFAHGLGIPVIWTCKKEDMKDLHFDVNHYSFITWEDGEDLKRKLIDRIGATIAPRP